MIDECKILMSLLSNPDNNQHAENEVSGLTAGDGIDMMAAIVDELLRLAIVRFFQFLYQSFTF
jgi:hypothetical protein